MHLKVSQGGDRRSYEFHSVLMQIIIRTISMTVASLIDFETRSMILFRGKVSKDAPKNEIVR